jgi:hypothetical protein
MVRVFHIFVVSGILNICPVFLLNSYKRSFKECVPAPEDYELAREALCTSPEDEERLAGTTPPNHVPTGFPMTRITVMGTNPARNHLGREKV